MNDYYANGRPRWDDQFRETYSERHDRQRRKRVAQGMAARSGETGTGSTEGNSPVANGDAPALPTTGDET